MKKSKFLIITGMSGAGKSSVIKILEDMDFFCIDNIPPMLITKFAELFLQMEEGSKVALVVDIRVGKSFEQMESVLRTLKSQGINYDLLFLESSDDKLVQRYKETRRKHPLAGDDRISIGISRERDFLEGVRSNATYLVDTTDMTLAELRQHIQDLFAQKSPKSAFSVTVLSFGFKYGLPKDADMVFDVRFMDNPFYVHELRFKNGNDKEVGDYIMKTPVAQQFLDKTEDLLLFLLPEFIKEGKMQLVLAIGCTGGMHRSVFITNCIAEALKSNGYKVHKEHRDIKKNRNSR